MSHDWYADVREFHERFGCHIGDRPAIVDEELMELRKKLIQEEWAETLAAMDRGDLDEIADGLADLIYVAIGAAITYGIDLRPVWDLVHAANMSKVGGATREDGKILKPAGWKAPDIAGEIRRQQEASIARPTEDRDSVRSLLDQLNAAEHQRDALLNVLHNIGAKLEFETMFFNCGACEATEKAVDECVTIIRQMMNDLLEELREKTKNHTPGPWVKQEPTEALIVSAVGISGL